MMIAIFSGSFLQGYDQDIASVLQNCQTIVNTLQSGDVDTLQELLQEQEMKEAFLISIIASQQRQ